MVACALDNLSARKFAEYLSLGQVPAFAGSAGFGLASRDAGHAEAPSEDDERRRTMPTSEDEVFGALADRAVERTTTNDPEPTENEVERSETTERQRSVRSPWRWERLLAESRVVATGDRWSGACTASRTSAGSRKPSSNARTRTRRGSIICSARSTTCSAWRRSRCRSCARWPSGQVQASWAEWLDRFDQLAPRVLQWPDRVLRVLADLRPMGAIAPVTLAEAMVVLADRLAASSSIRRRGDTVASSLPAPRSCAADPSTWCSCPRWRSGSFRRSRERIRCCSTRRGPLWTPAAAAIRARRTRAAAVAAGSRRRGVAPLRVVSDHRDRRGPPRVPSLYALEIWRAMTGRVPDAEELQHAAARASEATLSWPAPPDRRDAIDALEHDLATLRSLAGEPDVRARGRAQYILRLNENLQRSVRDRYMRGKKAWSRWDGIVAPTDRLAPILAAHRLSARRYSLSALQKYANCPYQFLLSTIHRLRPADDLEPLHRMDPLTAAVCFTRCRRRSTGAFRTKARFRSRPPAATARSPCSTKS
jgi:hypothetical protein